MRIGTLIIIAVAAVCAFFAAILANMWLHKQGPQPVTVNKAPDNVKMSRVVVAKQNLRFGQTLSAANLRVIQWPKESIPKGAFRNVKTLLRKGKRQVLIAIAANEPILKSKVTKPGVKASLSTVISEDKRAVTIRVNDVLGVAGLIHPLDYVDIAITRTSNVGNEGGKGEKAFTDVLLQNVKVLAIDQSANRKTKNKPAKTVTLEVNTIQAQKLALGSSIGKLSLMLRGAGSSEKLVTRRIDIDDLLKTDVDTNSGSQSSPSVIVTRSVDRKEYKVPNDIQRFQSVQDDVNQSNN